MCKLPSTSEKYNALASSVIGENQNINNRINWLLISQSFLVAAIAFLMDSGLGYDAIIFIAISISVLGILLCASVLLGVIGAHWAIQELKKHWSDDEFKGYVKPYGEGKSRIGDFTRFLVPSIIILFWLLLIFMVPELLNC